MKRELAEEDKQQQHQQNQDHHPMFSKFHHLSSTTPGGGGGDYQEADSHTPTNAAADGATIEVVRRPRGRPPGSKNKPKPPVIITRDAAEPAMSPYVLELPGGVDIVDSTARFCRKRNIGLCLLSGSGAVSNVTLKQPSSTPAATVTFHGRFDILSISATLLPPSANSPSPSSPFSLSLAGPQGQVVGGHVVGPLISAGTIYLVAANFTNPSFHRLQAAEHEEDDNSGGHDSPKTISGGGSAPPPPTYSYQANDVVWAPANRHQPPPY
ncbi:AT-hook motif nuclear-localized protein 28-like [Salvia hispanica]|uniref:AT-hook motif nuclear-localized protein 28-like n=1 Tax=Salvia hispanica TaxID=49212 RepID=UPI002009D87D|nr:AT-hook motif nuclear-localized protein 28-like [Salvia hispanica]